MANAAANRSKQAPQALFRGLRSLFCAGRDNAHWVWSLAEALIGLEPGAIAGGGSETGGIPVDSLATGYEF